MQHNPAIMKTVTHVTKRGTDSAVSGEKQNLQNTTPLTKAGSNWMSGVANIKREAGYPPNSDCRPIVWVTHSPAPTLNLVSLKAGAPVIPGLILLENPNRSTGIPITLSNL